MRFKYQDFILFLIVLFGFACQSDPEISRPQLPYHFIDFVKYSVDCERDSIRCAVFKAKYPEYDSAELDIKNKINEAIMDYVLESVSDETQSSPESLAQVAANFFEDYASFAIDGFAMPWELNCEGKVIYQNDKIFSLALNNYRFTGGAHPNTHTKILNFDLKEGRVLSIEDLITDWKAFTQLAEGSLRAEKGIDDSVSWSEAGFFMEHFQVSSNFALTTEGIMLYYNTYEIAPYAAGITEFVIPYDRLKGVIRPEFVPNIS